MDDNKKENKKKNYKFLQICGTSYHCLPCKENFKCKKNLSEKDKIEREKEFKNSGVPKCSLCDLQHWRCKNKKCTNCCELNKCNKITCDYCTSKNIKCERSLPNDQSSYDIIKSKVSYICGQFEATDNGTLHAQMFLQFKERQTKKTAKEILNDSSISFPDYLKGNSEQNKNYAMKLYNRCKKHSNCRCDYFDLSKTCDQCDTSCLRTFA